VSPGCASCYAARLAATRLAQQPRYQGLATLNGAGRGVWSGAVRLHKDLLSVPLKWRAPKRIFVCDMSDLCHEDVPDSFLVRVWMTMHEAWWHTFQLLTKRPERLRDFARRWADLDGEIQDPRLVRGPEATREAHPSGRGQLFADFLESMGSLPPGAAYPTFDWMEGPRWWPAMPPNVWVGTSVEDQRRADERVPPLLETPARVRFLSCEPLLGPVDLWHPAFSMCDLHGEPSGPRLSPDGRPAIGWVIVGGESGPNHRPSEVGWITGLVDQCREAGVPVFVKQDSGPRPGAQGRIPPDVWRMKEFPTEG
jgi:protein gp37